MSPGHYWPVSCTGRSLSIVFEAHPRVVRHGERLTCIVMMFSVLTQFQGHGGEQDVFTLRLSILNLNSTYGRQ